MNHRASRESPAARRAITTILMALLALPWAGTAWAQAADAGRPLRTAAAREGARLAQAGASDPQPHGGAGRNVVVRHPVLAGTVIGAGAGLALSQFDSIGGLKHDRRLALVGAGGGAWGGLIASAVQTAHAGRRVGLGTKIGIVAGAVAATVLPALALYGAGG